MKKDRVRILRLVPSENYLWLNNKKTFSENRKSKDLQLTALKAVTKSKCIDVFEGYNLENMSTLCLEKHIADKKPDFIEITFVCNKNLKPTVMDYIINKYSGGHLVMAKGVWKLLPDGGIEFVFQEKDKYIRQKNAIKKAIGFS